MPVTLGRERDARLIRQANRAAAVGRLMLGQFHTWHEFLQADVIDLTRLPRRQLRSGTADVRNRLSAEIEDFCRQNFKGMDERKLSQLYEEIKAFRGLEMPLIEFERRFAPIRRKILEGRPKHLTISISLWGLQFKFPEDEMTKDLIEALQIVFEAHTQLKQDEVKSHATLRRERSRISSLIRKKSFAARTVLISCFNLIEAFLNGLAWDYVQTHGTANLSNSQKKLLEDASSVTIREKLMKYPLVITGRQLWQESDEDLNAFLDTVKPFRDALVHPSPFSAPARFGGHDKLCLFYRVDYDTAILTAHLATNLIKRLYTHVYGAITVLPEWIIALEGKLEEYSTKIGSPSR